MIPSVCIVAAIKQEEIELTPSGLLLFIASVSGTVLRKNETTHIKTDESLDLDGTHILVGGEKQKARKQIDSSTQILIGAADKRGYGKSRAWQTLPEDSK